MKRKRTPSTILKSTYASENNAEEWDDENFRELRYRIKNEVAVLQSLEAAIDEDHTDTEEPVTVGLSRQLDTVSASARTDCEAGIAADGCLGNSMVNLAAPAEKGSRSVQEPSQIIHGTEMDEDAGLRARLKRAKCKAKKKQKKDFAGFNLEVIDGQIASYIADAGDTNGLELPNFSKMQRMQVRALAAVYGLECRACGRTGQTLFKTDRAGPLSTEGQLQVQRLLACSVPHGRPTLELRQEMEQAMRSARASMHRHIPSDNRGSVLLRRMGWSEGSGLGAQRQGRREPVPLHLGQRRQGLGSSEPVVWENRSLGMTTAPSKPP